MNAYTIAKRITGNNAARSVQNGRNDMLAEQIDLMREQLPKVREAVEALKDAVAAFVGEAEASDDLTLLCLRIKKV